MGREKFFFFLGIKRSPSTHLSDSSSSSSPIFIPSQFLYPAQEFFFFLIKTYTPPPLRYLPVLQCFYPTQTYHQDFIASLPIALKPYISHTLPYAPAHPTPPISHRSSSTLQTFKHAFNTNPQCPLASLPPSCHARKITLLLPSYGTPGAICTPHHLTTDAWVQRQHLGRAILDIR